MSDLLRRRAMMAQSRGKTMQLLTEYTVTEPVHSFQIPFTEKMKSCGVLYCALDLSFSNTDYFYIGFGGSNQAHAWFPGASSVVSTATIFHADQVTIDGTTFPQRWVMYPGTTNGAVPRVSGRTPSYINCYMYSASTNIISGTIKVYGEV